MEKPKFVFTGIVLQEAKGSCALCQDPRFAEPESIIDTFPLTVQAEVCVYA